MSLVLKRVLAILIGLAFMCFELYLNIGQGKGFMFFPLGLMFIVMGWHHRFEIQRIGLIIRVMGIGEFVKNLAMVYLGYGFFPLYFMLFSGLGGVGLSMLFRPLIVPGNEKVGLGDPNILDDLDLNSPTRGEEIDWNNPNALDDLVKNSPKSDKIVWLTGGILGSFVALLTVKYVFASKEYGSLLFTLIVVTIYAARKILRKSTSNQQIA